MAHMASGECYRVCAKVIFTEYNKNFQNKTSNVFIKYEFDINHASEMNEKYTIYND